MNNPLNHTSASNKLQKFSDIYSFLRQYHGSLPPQIETVNDEIIGVLKKAKRREDTTGESAKWVPLTYKDMRHICLCNLERYPVFPFWVLQRVFMASLGQNSGRRSVELHSIAASSFKLTWQYTKEKTRFGVLHFKYSYQKMKGPGVFNQCFAEPVCQDVFDGPVSNAIIFALAYFERMGMIDSALDVYNEKVTLAIDANVFETANDLKEKLKTVIRLSKEKSREYLNIMMEPKNEEQGTQLDSLVATVNFARLLSKEDEKTKKIPLWISQSCHGKLSCERFNKTGKRPLAELMILVGFLPSIHKRTGTTSTRHFFRKLSGGKTVEGFHTERHLTLHMGNTSAVGMGVYEDPNEYKRMMPANICQPTVGPQVAEAVVTNGEDVRPAYEVEDFFNSNVKVRKGDVPWERNPHLFLIVHAKNKDAFGVIDPMDLECPNKTCNETFKYEVQLAKHLQTCCDNDLVCVCGKEFVNYQNLQQHHRSCRHRPHFGKRERKAYDVNIVKELDFTNTFPCPHCGEMYGSEPSLKKHIAQGKKCKKLQEQKVPAK
jgi:hypothetical protein